MFYSSNALPKVLKFFLALTLSVSLICALTYKLAFGVSGINLYSLLTLSSWGVSHGFVWQFITYLFVQPIAYGIGFGFLLNLFFNLYFLWILGKAIIDLKGNKHFLGLYLGGGIISTMISCLILYSLSLPFALAGSSSAIYALLAAWTFLLPEREVLFFFVLPIRIKWLFVIIVGSTLFIDLANGNFFHFLVYLCSSVFGYLYALLAFENLSPFTSLHSFERALLRIKYKLFGSKHAPSEIFINPKKTKIYDFKTGKVILDDDAFVDVCLSKISKYGKKSLTFYERFRLWRISKKRAAGRYS